MKEYTKPKIQIIAMDPKQVVLNVCQVGGQYLGALTPSLIAANCYYNTGTLVSVCIYTPKQNPVTAVSATSAHMGAVPS
ncbi:MAG: hypothetical protein PHQ52_01370 [Candidatus Omnitrophica bacterium]|nr:hypothetical protein [Candidatus Omnitrophota bacterium]